ncbi:MAG: HAMP domain-containing sensor histidine kinase [Sedimentibacter sp.]|uniref:sensor histidine kinase n=1 Tax=Sedimentibacter sp. TaxID=1960295 RepID=UPI0031591892
MKVKNRLLINYVLMFVITSAIAVIAVVILSVASGILESSLVKNRYTASSLMKDDIAHIEYNDIINNNGGIQVIDYDYRIVLSEGISNFPKSQLTASEFTEFLTQSQSTTRKFSYSIAYNEKMKFWLIVTFPTSIRIDFNVTRNSFYRSADTGAVTWFIVIVVAVYVIMLIISTLIYSRFTASSFTRPLAMLQEYTNKLRNGDYSARANLDLDNEFGDLERSFNEMANQIQTEISLRKKSEDIRRQLTLDIVHDLKNPLSAIMGYAEYCLNNPDQANENYIRSIYHNGSRANSLLTGLFELSKLESSEYRLNMKKTDLSEYLRAKIADLIDELESSGFAYEFEIPEGELYVKLDEKEMDRVFDNLFQNATRYNGKGTKISLTLKECDGHAEIMLSDNGIGIDKDLSEKIFSPFVRADKSRNSETGGSGLGLAIAEKIIRLHGGNIYLVSDVGMGCTFYIELPI